MKSHALAALALALAGSAAVTGAPAHALQVRPALEQSVPNAAYGEPGTNASRRQRAEPWSPSPRSERASQVWSGAGERMACRRGNDTTGLMVGGAGGALAGHEIAGRGNRTLGAIIGALGGSLLGREVERRSERCR